MWRSLGIAVTQEREQAVRMRGTVGRLEGAKEERVFSPPKQRLLAI